MYKNGKIIVKTIPKSRMKWMDVETSRSSNSNFGRSPAAYFSWENSPARCRAVHMCQMSAIFGLEETLRQFAENADEIPMKVNTVGECVKDLIRRFPSIEEWLFDKNGILKSLILFDGHAINPKELDHAVKDNSELLILLIMAGG